MKIACSSSLAFPREAFETLGEVVICPDRAMSPDDVREADLLIVRSTTRITPALLDGSRVRFVGTATIGTDHFDMGYLDARGIHWCYAPGCNANSVSEYVTAALLCLAARHGFSLEGKTLGVVGVGNVGSKVVRKAEALGMRVLQNDPPRQRAEYPGADRSSCPFVSLDRLLAESDVVTLHVPLTRDGPDGTAHLANKSFFGKMKPGAIFLNSARGPVTEAAALLQALDAGIVAHAVIDTWDPEPAFPAGLLERVDLGTPHIAGYSFEGKVYGTYQVYQEACRFLDVSPTWSPDAVLAPPPGSPIQLDPSNGHMETALWNVVKQVYDIEEDDRTLRDGCAMEDAPRAAHFDQLRRSYRVRREYPSAQVAAAGAPEAWATLLGELGFRLENTNEPRMESDEHGHT